MSWWLIGAGCWLAVSVALALALGHLIGRADERERIQRVLAAPAPRLSPLRRAGRCGVAVVRHPVLAAERRPHARRSGLV